MQLAARIAILRPPTPLSVCWRTDERSGLSGRGQGLRAAAFRSGWDLRCKTQNPTPAPPPPPAAVVEVHGWLTAARGEPDDAEREAMGWVVAYDLRAWQEFPGKGFGDLGGALKQQFVGGVLGGPSPKDKSEASVLRSKLASSQTPKNDKQGEGFFAEPVTDKDPAAAEN